MDIEEQNGQQEELSAAQKILSDWYVIQVYTGDEDEMIDLFRPLIKPELGEEVFTMRKKKVLHGREGRYTANLPMFPGYIFIKTDDIMRIRKEMRVIVQFKRILRAGNREFMPLYREEVRVFEQLGGPEHVVEISIGFKEGDEIGVLDGPLVLYTGKIEKINRHKRTAMIRAMFMGEERVIPVGLEVLATKTEAENLRARMRLKGIIDAYQ